MNVQEVIAVNNPGFMWKHDVICVDAAVCGPHIH